MRVLVKLLLPFFFSVLLFACDISTVWALPPKIKLLIGSFHKSLSIRGSKLSVSFTDNTGEHKSVFGSNMVNIYKKKNGITINKHYLAGKRFILSSSDGVLTIEGSQYTDIVLLYLQNENILIINEIDIERYLQGLVPLEISPLWDLNTMKVQAVAARSYALYQKEKNFDRPYHMQSTFLNQIYQGINNENERAKRAVIETEGEVVTYDGEPIMAAFHSCCGGRTSAAKDVWGKDLPYLKSVSCRACTSYDRYFWKVTLSFDILKRLLRESGHEIGMPKHITITKRGTDNRIQEVQITGTKSMLSLRGNDLRSLIGFTVLRSTNFIIKNSTGSDSLQFLGIGYGHGVGLCQWGAREHSLRGDTYKDILLYYYPGTKIEKIY